MNHAGKEGPHLTMTGGLGGFTELQHLCWFLRTAKCRGYSKQGMIPLDCVEMLGE